jgi:hypothetical protein
VGSRKADVVECDNPTCKTPPKITSKDDPVIGIYLKGGLWVYSGGGIAIPDIYACTPKCLPAAVEHVIEEVNRG